MSQEELIEIVIEKLGNHVENNLSPNELFTLINQLSELQRGLNDDLMSMPVFG